MHSFVVAMKAETVVYNKKSLNKSYEPSKFEQLLQKLDCNTLYPSCYYPYVLLLKISSLNASRTGGIEFFVFVVSENLFRRKS